MSSWPKLVLFGDSLTQYSFGNEGWASLLADRLQRKGDVLNRGFEGYNTDFALKILDNVFPSGFLKTGDSVFVFFGTNDACLANVSSQHVPLDRYEQNLCKILDFFIKSGIPTNRIVLISPPPVDAEARLRNMIAHNEGDVCDCRNDITKTYADACKKVCIKYACNFLNSWETIMRRDNWKEYLCDGLHFSKSGNKLLADCLTRFVDQLTESWPIHLPDWKELVSNLE